MTRHSFPLLVLIIACLVPITASAAAPTPFQRAEDIRTALLNAQLELADNPTTAAQSITTAQQSYEGNFAATIANASPRADQHIREGLTNAQRAIAANDPILLADARAQVWTALLAGGYAVVEQSLTKNDPLTAQTWLPLREFRRVTRFTRPNADATRALTAFAEGTLNLNDTLTAVRADVLDNYQARLKVALDDTLASEQKNYPMRRAESASLAAGYFEILAPAYTAQYGAQQTAQLQNQFAALRAAARAHASVVPALDSINLALQSFRAAPLNPAEQTRRAGQFQRFLNLVPVEYGRGIGAGVVTSDLEIQEASTFRDGAEAAFDDLHTLLAARDPQKTVHIAALLDQLQTMLADTAAHRTIASPADIQNITDEISTTLNSISPAEWSAHDTQGDFDVVASLLDQMERAVDAGQYDLAESARLEAYAVMESGPEARLVAAAPQLKAPIEDLFWNGQGDAPGLAYLIRQHAPPDKIKTSRAALDVQLNTAQHELASSAAPAAVATNAGIIVFREGLEAVLILAALLSSMKLGEARKFRKPMWLGVVVAFVVTILTWVLARTILSSLARYGDTLEAVVSLIAIAILFLVLNWFFHKVYWTGWIGNFQTRKRALLGQATGQMLGLAVLGFTSVYREGFETVLFLQALVLEAGVTTVLIGIAIGLAAVVLVGIATFVLQAKLPYKKMLIATGIMIGAVLLIMVGNTIHVMQVIGWLPITPLRFLNVPYWMGIWFGIYPTLETLGGQALALLYVVGSYYLAERHNRRGTGTVSPAQSIATRAP